MQTVSSRFLNALVYSHTPLDRVDVFRGGALVAPDLQVAPGGGIRISGGDGQVVRSTCNVTVLDPTGKLVPEKADDPLAPFGSELRVQMGVKTGTIPEMVVKGFFPINEVQIDEQIGRVSRPDEPGRDIWYSRGATLAVGCLDRLKYIETNKFISREQPSQGTVFPEARLLLNDNQPGYGGHIGNIADRSIPGGEGGTTYDLDRLKALLDLGDLIDADAMIDERGLFVYRSKEEREPVWRLEAGQFSFHEKIRRTLTAEGVYNGAIEKGTGEDNVLIQAFRLIETGPLAWGGPFGKVGLQHSSPLLKTQGAVEVGVESVLRRAQKVTPQKIPLVCPRNPALQWGDTIELPTRYGQYIPVVITELAFPFGAQTMSLVVAADPFQLRGLL